MTKVAWAVTRTGRLSEAELAQVEALAERGLRSHAIARRLGRHPSGIHYRFILMGLAPPRQPASDSRAGARTVVRFCEAEDRMIEGLRQQGAGIAAIARECLRQFGRRRRESSVRVRLLQLAAREEA